MPDLLENPPQITRRLNKPWTAEQAREMARRSHLPGSARYRKLPPLPQEQPQPAQDQRLELLAEQIARTRITLNGKLEPQHRAALLRALCDLLDQQRIARGEPLPGSRKPAPERRQVNDAPLRPVPAHACGVDTTTNGVNQQQPANETPQGNSSQ